MVANDKTVFDPGATMPESDKTVLESGAALSDGGTTMLEAALSDAAERADADARENVAIIQGDMILDTYRIESDAIEGGMGSVWRVHHTGWNVDLAMKRPQPKCFSTEKSKADFIHECEAWINLGLHPNIVSCYYVREIQNVPTIFSEWMDGGSLESAITKSILYEGTQGEQRKRLLDIAIQFARGLHYAHEAGLIHQDVKPDNVLLTKEGEAKVADFGLARARAMLTALEGDSTMHDTAESGKTMLSPSGGYTPAYCSMEQMDGRELTRRTDIYSWAVSVMEMYLGSRPWANGVVAGLSCRNYFEQTRVSMPEALKELLAQCLEGEPENRPHDFAEVESKLHGIYQAETGSGYPRPESKAAADTADSLNNRALSFLDLGRPDEAERLWEKAAKDNRVHFPSVYNNALHRWRSGRQDDLGAVNQVQNCMRNGPAQNGRARCLLAKMHSERGDEEAARDMLLGVGANDADYGQAESLLQTLGQRTPRQEERLSVNRGVVERLFMSRDGKCLIVGTEYGWSKWRIDMSECVECVWPRPASGKRGPRPSAFPIAPDRLLDIYRENDAAFAEIWDIEEGRCLCTLSDSAFFHQGLGIKHMMVDVSRDDRIALTASRVGSEALLWDVKSGRRIHVLRGHADNIKALALSRDGRLALTGAADATARLWDTRTGDCLRVFSFGETVSAAAFAANGRRIVLGGTKGALNLYETADGTCAVRFYGHESNERITVDEAGAYMLSMGEPDHAVKLWSLQSGKCLRTYPQGGGERCCCLSADGETIFTGDWYDVRILPVKKQTPLCPWELSRIQTTSVQAENEVRFRALLADIDAAKRVGDVGSALRLCALAEQIPGFAGHAALLRAYAEIGKFCKRESVLAVRPRRLLKDVLPTRMHAPVCNSDLSLLAVGDDDNALRIWDVEREACLFMKENAQPDGFYRLLFHPDGRRLISWGKKGVIQLLDAKTGSVEKTFQTQYDMTGQRYAGRICASPDGRSLFIAKGEILSQICLSDGACFAEARLNGFFFQSISAVCVSPSCDCVAVAARGASESYLFLFALKDGLLQEEGVELQGSKTIRTYSALAFSEDGLRFAAVDPERITLWDVSNQTKRLLFFRNDHWLEECAFSPDGQFVFGSGSLGSEKGVAVWSQTTGELLSKSGITKYNYNPSALRISCDGNALAVQCDKDLFFYDTAYSYAFPGWADWDEGARRYVEIYLALHPNWTDADFQNLILDLQTRGYGWLRPEGVRAKLMEMKPKDGRPRTEKLKFSLFGKKQS